MGSKLTDGILFGAGGGFGAGFAIAFFQCALAIVSCDDATGFGDLFLTVILFTIIGAVIGAFVGKKKQEEADLENERKALEQAQIDKKEEEIRKNQAEQQKVNNWTQYLKHSYDEIMQKVVSLDSNIDYNSLYSTIEDRKSDPDININSKLCNVYESSKEAHIEMLHDVVRDVLSETSDIGSVRLIYVENAIKCLRIVSSNDAEYADAAYERIQEIRKESNVPTLRIDFSSYGEPDSSSFNEKFFKAYSAHAEDLIKKLESVNEIVKPGTCECIANRFPEMFIGTSCDLVWYYAMKMPFEVDKFDRAVNLFEKYTQWVFNNSDSGTDNIYRVCKVEDILARVYSKKNIGGEGTAKQELDFISQWIEGSLILAQEGKYNIENNQELYALASGLAWMELYEMELVVLHKLVEGGVQLPEELQARLIFLESGGKGDIKIYNDVPYGVFAYDNSAIDWRKNEFDVFFRKLANKKIIPDYALALERWTKTLPLMKGQKVSNDSIIDAFQEMVEDFEGEIECSQVSGKAINLENVTNENATLFTFTSERNRCVAILFSSEKYGRNLNIEILTMFVPEKGLEVNQLEKYCAAIKGNVYVDSFKETILQTLDEVLRVKEEMYSTVTSTNTSEEIYD